jgi:hypothetical protein
MRVIKEEGSSGDFDSHRITWLEAQGEKIIIVELHEEHHGSCAFRPCDWGYIIPGHMTEKEVWEVLNNPNSEYLAVWKNKYCCEECCPQQKKEEDFYLQTEEEVIKFRKKRSEKKRKKEKEIEGIIKNGSFEELRKMLKENRNMDLNSLTFLVKKELLKRIEEQK